MQDDDPSSPYWLYVATSWAALLRYLRSRSADTIASIDATLTSVPGQTPQTTSLTTRTSRSDANVALGDTGSVTWSQADASSCWAVVPVQVDGSNRACRTAKLAATADG